MAVKIPIDAPKAPKSGIKQIEIATQKSADAKNSIAWYFNLSSTNTKVFAICCVRVMKPKTTNIIIT